MTEQSVPHLHMPLLPLRLLRLEFPVELLALRPVR
jgi:hypothetical protein